MVVLFSLILIINQSKEDSFFIKVRSAGWKMQIKDLTNYYWGSFDTYKRTNFLEDAYKVLVSSYYVIGYYFWKFNKDSLKVYIDSTLKVLEDAANFHNDAGLWAYCGYIYGSKIPVSSFFKVMGLSGRANRCFERAFEIDSLNALVLFFKGLNVYRTPKGFGGGCKNALSYFDKSLRAYSQNKLHNFLNKWGEEEAMFYYSLCVLEIKKDLKKVKEICNEMKKKYPNFWGCIKLKYIIESKKEDK